MRLIYRVYTAGSQTPDVWPGELYPQATGSGALCLIGPGEHVIAVYAPGCWRLVERVDEQDAEQNHDRVGEQDEEVAGVEAG